MKYTVQFLDESNEDMERLYENYPKLYNKAFKFIDELKEHPRTGTGHPERLKHYEEETWSRQLDKQHRLVYEIHDDVVIVIVLSAYGHYEDK